MALMQKAEKAKQAFTPPNVDEFVPPELADAVARIYAAGVKLMTSPEMRDQVQAAIESPEPVAKVLGQNVAGLLLTLDEKSNGQLPVDAIFPAGMKLLTEAAAMMSAAGKTVDEQDFKDATYVLYITHFQKMGASEADIMDGARQAAGGQGEMEEPDGPEEPNSAPEPDQDEVMA
jgi:hypothetical protein